VTRAVLASANPGKLREFAQLLAPLAVCLTPQAELGIRPAAETGATFLENALLKARHAAHHARLPALADDSGICVDALQGAPGVHSARFADDGPAATTRAEQDERNNQKLLTLLSNDTNRKAHYYCVIVLTRSAGDPQPIICEAEWHGEIARGRRGSGGFGYDPLFFIPALRKTGAELRADDKNRISHRGQALAALAARLDPHAGVSIGRRRTSKD